MEAKLVVGFVVLGLCGYLCDGQRWQPKTNTKAPATAQVIYRKPKLSQTPTVALPTVKTVLPQTPGVVRPTASVPKKTPGPTTQGVVKYPTLERPDVVKAYCGESSVQIEVEMDFLGIGHLIQPSDLTLGGCGPVGQDDSASVLLFETELHGCGSKLEMTEETLVYTFLLDYHPTALDGTPIVRTNHAEVSIKCHYTRLHNVSSNALKPTWIPYRSTLSAEDLLVLTMRIMQDGWRTERSDNMFFLGDLINIEASVVQANHVPLRVFVDTCVATLEPSMDAVPRYAFIEGKGCLMDSKLTSSRSKFLSREQDGKLQFQLDAFRFAQESRSSIYITCHLRATAAASASEGKACSFSVAANGWTSASGDDQACSCCDTGCSMRKGRSLAAETVHEADMVLGPLIVQRVVPDDDMVHEFQSNRLTAEDHRAAGVSPVAVVMAGMVAAVGLVCVVVLGAVLIRTRHKP